MKNIFFIINDSMRYEAIGNNIDWGKSATPFIDSISNKSFIATNLYSEGPFTEAAMKSLLTGRDLLSDCDYLFRLNKLPVTIFDVAEKNGYEIFHTYIPGMLLSDRVKNKIKHLIYAECPDYMDFYLYRVEYYCSLIKSGISVDYEKIIGLYEIFFCETLSFYRGYLDNPNADSYEFVKGQLSEIDVHHFYDIWNKEFMLFKDDKKEYVKQILLEQKEHTLYKENAKINTLGFDINILKKIYEENKVFFKECKKIQRKYALRNGVEYGPLVKSFFERVSQKIRGVKLINMHTSNYFSNWNGLYRNNDWENLFEKPNENDFEIFPSMKKQIDFYVDKLKKRKNRKKPFLVVMHTLSAHHLNYFISHDISDINEIHKELDIQKKDFDNLSSKFKGFLTYRQAIRYIDYCTEHLFYELKKNGLDKNTIFSFSADHGSSFGPSWNRSEPRVNNFHFENYHIPLLVYDGSISTKYTGHATSKDVFPTVFQLAGMNDTDEFEGHSLLKYQGCGISHSEYLGPGCPDIDYKKIWFIARDDYYSVGYRVSINEDFNDGKIVACFDKKNDPYELKNLVNTINRKLIKRHLDFLRQRFLEIKINKAKHNDDE